MRHKGEINSNNLGNRAELTELVAFLANMRQKVLAWGLLIVKPIFWLFYSLVQYYLGVKSLRCFINTTPLFWFQSCVIALHPQLSWCQAPRAYKEARKEEKRRGGLEGLFAHLLSWDDYTFTLWFIWVGVWWLQQISSKANPQTSASAQVWSAMNETFGCGSKSCAAESRESWERVQDNYYYWIILGKAVSDRNDKVFTETIVRLEFFFFAWHFVLSGYYTGLRPSLLRRWNIFSWLTFKIVWPYVGKEKTLQNRSQKATTSFSSTSPQYLKGVSSILTRTHTKMSCVCQNPKHQMRTFSLWDLKKQGGQKSEKG